MLKDTKMTFVTGLTTLLGIKQTNNCKLLCTKVYRHYFFKITFIDKFLLQLFGHSDI